MSKAEIILPFPLAETSQNLHRVEAFVVGQKQFNVKIPPGIQIGQKLRLRGIAHYIHPTLKNNDVLLQVLPSNSIMYHLRRDVHMELPLNPRQRELGVIQRVVLGGRKFDVKVPANVEFGKKIRMNSMAYLCNDGYPGDVFLKAVPFNSPKRRFWGVFGDFDTAVGRKITLKVGIPRLFEFGTELEYARMPAEIQLG
jgi:hypothetical protein